MKLDYVERASIEADAAILALLVLKATKTVEMSWFVVILPFFINLITVLLNYIWNIWTKKEE